LQYIESSCLAPIVNKHGISGYYRYVDDILIIYDSSFTNISSILNDFNNIHTNLQFTLETEFNNNINYLDISIHRSETDLTFHIYRKPTFTDTIIPHDSCHPVQHKHAAIRFLYNRLYTYDLDEDAKSKELNTIHILYNNKFPLQYCDYTSKHRTPTQPQKYTHKWATFTYVGKETRFITQIFRNTDLKIAYKVNSTIETLSKTTRTHLDKYSASGIYKLTRPDCGKAYVGQTGRSFSVRYKELRHSFRTNNTNSNFAQHLINNIHTFAPIDATMHILEFQKKSRHLNTLEKYYI
jgi:hypothetical protein